MRDPHAKQHSTKLSVIINKAEAENKKTRQEKRTEKVKLLLQRYQVDLDKLMSDYLNSLNTSLDDDNVRFNKANMKWKNICSNAMKTHKDIKMNPLAFENTFKWILSEHERQKMEHEPKIITL